MPRVVSAAEARAGFSRILSDAYDRGEPTVITRNGKPIAVLIGIEEYKVRLMPEPRRPDAREIARLTLERMGLPADPLIRFDEIKLENPEAIAAAITETFGTDDPVVKDIFRNTRGEFDDLVIDSSPATGGRCQEMQRCVSQRQP